MVKRKREHMRDCYACPVYCLWRAGDTGTENPNTAQWLDQAELRVLEARAAGIHKAEYWRRYIWSPQARKQATERELHGLPWFPSSLLLSTKQWAARAVKKDLRARERTAQRSKRNNHRIPNRTQKGSNQQAPMKKSSKTQASGTVLRRVIASEWGATSPTLQGAPVLPKSLKISL